MAVLEGAAVKTCTCCKKTYNAEQYAALAVLQGPPMEYDDDAGQWWRLVLRNCDCNGTMAEQVSISAPT